MILKLITSIYRQEFKRIFELKAFDGMKECLELLKTAFPALSSIRFGPFYCSRYRGPAFPGIFDTVVTGDDVTNSKPHPDPFLKAVELLKVRREECVIIENAILGVEAAKKAEIYCIGVPTYLEPSQLDRADLVVGDHKKLMEHLLSLEPALRFRI